MRASSTIACRALPSCRNISPRRWGKTPTGRVPTAPKAWANREFFQSRPRSATRFTARPARAFETCRSLLSVSGARSATTSGDSNMERNPQFDKIIKAIEAQQSELVELCLQLGNTPSHHGKERRLGEAVLQWLNDAGIPGELQFITDDSVNAVATLAGNGDGKSLIWNAHMDTGPELGADATDDERKLETAWIEGDMLFGKGMINDKAQLCAFMIAMRALKQNGIKLKGDLILTAVAFETGDPSIDGQQGINFPGEGFGTKWVVDRGVVADYALVGETSGFGIVQAECGAAWIKVRIKGRSAYTPRLERGSSIQENPNVFAKAAYVIQALEEWAIEYEKRETFKFPSGTIIPKAQIVDMRGGDRVGRPNPFCDIFLDVRILPEKNPNHVKSEIAELTRKLKFDCDVSLFQFSRGQIGR